MQRRINASRSARWDRFICDRIAVSLSSRSTSVMLSQNAIWTTPTKFHVPAHKLVGLGRLLSLPPRPPPNWPKLGDERSEKLPESVRKCLISRTNGKCSPRTHISAASTHLRCHPYRPSGDICPTSTRRRVPLHLTTDSEAWNSRAPRGADLDSINTRMTDIVIFSTAYRQHDPQFARYMREGNSGQSYSFQRIFRLWRRNVCRPRRWMGALHLARRFGFARAAGKESMLERRANGPNARKRVNGERTYKLETRLVSTIYVRYGASSLWYLLVPVGLAAGGKWGFRTWKELSWAVVTRYSEVEEWNVGQ
ncbi:hypothetical protein EDB85DRAFT_1894840 [Lactarius pseudohatsudake]|nr:hypothetical protein EDB85DRAFT_1894840 [Lactarius pseudohatsudake]